VTTAPERPYVIADIHATRTDSENRGPALAVADMQASSIPDWRAILDRLHAFVGLLSPDGTVLSANQAPLEASGLTVAQVVGRRFWDCAWWAFDAATARLIESVCGQVAGDGVTRRFDIQFMSMHGPRWIDLAIAPLPGPDGRTQFLVPSAVDIDDRVSAFKALSQTERQLSGVLKNASAAVFVMNERQHCTYMNAAAERLTGYALADVTGRPLHDVLHHTRPDGSHYPLAACPIDRALPTNDRQQGEEVFVHRDGSFYPVAFTASPLRDSAGTPVGTVIEVRDLRPEREAHAIREKLVALVDNSDEYIGLASLDGRIEYLNPAGRRLIGVDDPAGEGSVHRIEDAIHPDSLQFFRNVFLPAVRSNGAMRAEMKMLNRRSGEAVHVARTTFLTYDPATAQPAGYGTVTRDISEQKQHEAAMEEADRRKDAFIATLAHELRNPLAPIRHAAALLHRELSAEQRQQVAGIVERQISHMARLLDDLLDAARINLGRLELKRADVSLREVIDTAVEAVQPLIAGRRQTLRVEVEHQADSRGVTVHADAVRLSQVIGNLLTNASKYSAEHKTIRVAVSLHRPGEVALSVSDEGIGFDAADVDNVFRMFWQSSESSARAAGGLGIGLALARSLVQMHGGTLTAHSDGPGRGSRFTVTLPVSRTAARASDHATAAPPAAALRVLVADDNDDAAATLAMALELHGHSVRTARDGHAALAELAAFPADVALLDLGMPGMGGIELATRLRQSPVNCRIRLAAITGWGSDLDRAATQEAGFEAHFVKPVDLAQVLRFLQPPAATMRPAAAN
jgi:PAS domain S-box-containing protein